MLGEFLCVVWAWHLVFSRLSYLVDHDCQGVTRVFSFGWLVCVTWDRVRIVLYAICMYLRALFFFFSFFLSLPLFKFFFLFSFSLPFSFSSLFSYPSFFFLFSLPLFSSLLSLLSFSFFLFSSPSPLPADPDPPHPLYPSSLLLSSLFGHVKV